MNPAELQATLQRNLDLIKRDTAGISDEDALKRIGQGSSLNWVVGHVLSSRTRIMEFLGVEDSTFKHDDISVLYGRDTQPDGANELPPLGQLLTLLDGTQPVSSDAIGTADLRKVIESPFGTKPIGDLINFLAWHEGYHAGQVILFRRWLE